MKKIISEEPISCARLLTNQMIEWFDAEKERDYFIAVSGGSTPMVLFHVWREEFMDKIDWKRLQIYWADERCVDPRHGDSNYGMTKKILLDHVPMKPEQIHRMIGEIDSAFEKERYAREVIDSVPTSNGIPQFDLILLGMGEDGHTASIFPTQDALYDVDEIFAVSQKPKTNSIRITMTGKLIRNAKKVLFFITGAAKAKIMSEIFSDHENAKAYPAYHFAKTCNDVTFYLDQNAASQIK
ncbi:MAG: 6-phosphogluconolactonase [Bacteroidales bacterium]